MMLSKTIATLATLVSLAAIVQGDMLSVSNPTKGTTWNVGESVFLQWNGNCASMGKLAKNVDVNLMTGPETALRFVAKLSSIDCSGSNTRKEFAIPADMVRAPGQYSLQVQTEPQPSYSNIFSVETTTIKQSGGIADKSATAGNGDDVVSNAHTNGGSVGLKKVESSTATASAVALAAVLVAAQLL
ncbi:hypothetical protein B0O80DRAFT_424102 [Mortierella sp. GBAus27b]|nr:hypothetical protein BGX31_004492 [Mortierella sp. GBA43]KAI8357991.1 hypothetical protein B0O80DRAFT_424102 [Mortierella sp. GBAus27b]